MRVNLGGFQNIRMALGAVTTHRFRSLLTILGIVIGITTVVTVASLLTGLRKGVVTFFQELGPDNIFVFKTSGDPGSPRTPEKERRRRELRPEYADQIRRWCVSSVKDVSLALFIPSIIQGRPMTARVPGYESDTINVVGVSPNAFDLSPRDIAEGRVFTAEEDARGMHVAVLGASLAEALFPQGHATGQQFFVDGAEFTVVGVAAKAKGGFFGENGLDNQVTIPLRTAQARYPQIDRYMLTAKARPGKRKDAYDEVEAVMRKIRRLKPGVENDFALSTPDQIIQQFDKITGLIGLVAIAISGLGLLVGGIGVMNIMLVSVTERTREIGVRKAIGALEREVLMQFLIESVVLACLGGLIGVALATGASAALASFMQVPFLFDPVINVVSFAFSAAIGVVFGYVPARRAARLDPIEALRHE
jgi:putative ABC transport system permease protein